MSTIDRVREFHTTFGHPVALELTPGDVKLRKLRINLIAEELCELCDALGAQLSIDVMMDGSHRVNVEMVKDDSGVDLVEAADALGDLDYVVQGANLVFGIPGEAVAQEIHSSNMSKAGKDGKPIYREDGKILKGPNYFRPNIYKVLMENT